MALVALAAALAGCGSFGNRGFQGWVEADMIFVSPDEFGRVTRLSVREGDEVKVGDSLYTVDDDLQLADLNQNKAMLANTEQAYERASSLRKTGAGTQAALDVAISDLRVAEARVVTSQTQLARRKAFAPVAGTIQQVYFREGETVGAQRAVISIMPPGNMKVRFYVPETELAKFSIGDEVSVTCDSCSKDLTARIYFIAFTAEYTPPVIYSLDERSKLVYLIQARPTRPDALRVGQPVSVFRIPKTSDQKGAAPKVAEPKAVEPKAVEPKASAPKAAAPRAAAPRVVEPKAPEPKAPEPKAPEPKAPEPKAPEPKVAEPSAPEPVAPEPRVEEPKVEEPRVEEPRVEEPRVTEPSAPEAAK